VTFVLFTLLRLVRLALISLHAAPLTHASPRVGGQNVYLHYLVKALRACGCCPVGIYDDADGARPGEYDIVTSHYWTAIPTAAALAQATDIPWVHTYHSLAPEEERDDGGGATGRRSELEELAATSAHAICANSSLDAHHISTRYDTRRAPVTVLPGVDLDRFRPGDRERQRRRLGLDGTPVVLCVGRIAKGKRLPLAVEAFARLLGVRSTDARLLIVGAPDGDHGFHELRRARRRATQLGIADKVRFAGAVAHTDLHHYYSAADALLFASQRESFGLVLLEAQACGLPVVTTAVGGATDVVQNGVTGFIVDHGDAEQLARRLDDALDPNLAPALRKGASQSAQRFTWDRTASRLLDVFQAVSEHVGVERDQLAWEAT
jgi:D-inositol-3-phosphate glycosyltransferase